MTELIDQTPAPTGQFVSLEYWAQRWGVDVKTLERNAVKDPNWPKIRRFGPRIRRVSLADIEAYEQEFSTQ